MKKEKGKPVRSTNGASLLPAGVPQPRSEEGSTTVKVTIENAPLAMVALLREIRDQNAKILKYFEAANNG
jgi:hypothetical protein